LQIGKEWILKKMGNGLVLEEDEDAELWAGFGFDLGWSRGNRATRISN
jgi:hypothetical protein